MAKPRVWMTSAKDFFALASASILVRSFSLSVRFNFTLTTDIFARSGRSSRWLPRDSSRHRGSPRPPFLLLRSMDLRLRPLIPVQNQRRQANRARNTADGQLDSYGRAQPFHPLYVAVSQMVSTQGRVFASYTSSTYRALTRRGISFRFSHHLKESEAWRFFSHRGASLN